jgi:hypothetical protein
MNQNKNQGRIWLSVSLMIMLVLGTTPVMGQVNPQAVSRRGGEIDGLTYVGHLDTPGDALEVAVVGDYAYICESGSLRIVDVYDPTTPVEVGFYAPPYGDGPCMTMAVVGNYVYTGGYYTLNILDVTNPAAPALVGKTSGLDMPTGLVVVGAYAYVVDIHDTGSGYLYRLLIFDVSNVTHPFITGVSTFISRVNDVDVEGGYAYVANDDAGLRVIDVSNPSAPFEVGSYTTISANGVTVAGSYAYVADPGWGLRIIDISNPTAPFQVSLFDSLGYTENSAVEWGYAYVAEGEVGVEMVNVLNPAAPVITGLYNTSGMTHDVAVAGDGYVYAADGNNGLVILRSSFSISGKVTKVGGDPVAGVTITATGGYTTTTDASGVYAFNDLESGTYTLTASKGGYSFVPESLTFTVPPGAIGDFVGEPSVHKMFIPSLAKDY